MRDSGNGHTTQDTQSDDPSATDGRGVGGMRAAAAAAATGVILPQPSRVPPLLRTRGTRSVTSVDGYGSSSVTGSSSLSSLLASVIKGHSDGANNNSWTSSPSDPDDFDGDPRQGGLTWFTHEVAEGMPRGRVRQFLVMEVTAYVLGLILLLLGSSGPLDNPKHHVESGWVLTNAQLIFLVTAACFVAVTTGDLHSIIGSSNPLKRQLLWVVFCINVQATCTYWLLCLGYLPAYDDGVGRPLYPLRYLMWACSTAGLIFLLDEVAQDRRRWFLRTVVGSDVVTIVLGFLSKCAQNQTTKWALFGAGCVTFLPTVWGMYSLFITGAEKMISRESTFYHKLLGCVTIVLWSAFPLIHVLSMLEMISMDNEALAYAILDIATKAAYSMCILRSNCFSIDQLEEIKRLDKEEILCKTTSTAREIELANRILMAAKSEAGAVKHLHELRTPLNSMIGFNELLIEDNELSASQRSYITSALKSAKGLLTMIDNILEYSRLENTFIPLQMQEFQLQDVIDDAIDSLRSKAICQGIDIVCFFESNIPNILVGDSSRLSQMITHLLDNAIKSYKGKHLTEEKPTINITVLPVTHNGGRNKRTDEAEKTITLDIEIEDHGRGIPADKQNKLFTPFGQVEPLEQREGIGLGLAIVKQLAEAMDGSVTCTSAEGIGSVFSLRNLPFRIGSNARHLESEPAENAPGVVLVAQGPTLQCLTYLLSNLNVPFEPVDASSGELRAWYTAMASDCKGEIAPDNQTEAGQCVRSRRESTADIDTLIIDAQLLSPLELERLPYNRVIILTAPSNRGEKGRSTVGRVVVDEIARPITRRVLSDVISMKPPSTLRKAKNRGAVHSDDLEAKPSPRGLAANNLMVLIVDDNKLNQKVVAAILRRLDIPYRVANDGIEAIECFCEDKYDVILMDLSMPRMGGLEATRIIRRMEASSGAPPVDVVAMTAATNPDDEELCWQSGFTLYLPKPVNFSSVKELLDKKKAEKMAQLAAAQREQQ